MIENLHPAIKNPEIYPSILLKKVNELVHSFVEQYQEDIKKGCERNFCVLPAIKLTDFLKKNGFTKAKKVRGIFRVDNPLPLSVNDFTEEERTLAKKQGYFLADKKSAEEFAVKNNLMDELKNIPHYWTQIDKLIIDFTGDGQFVKTGMAGDSNISRYKRNIQEQQLNELGDSIYPYNWGEKDDDRWMGKFLTADKKVVSFIADLYNKKSNTWAVKFKKSNTYFLTNEGDAYKVLTTLQKMLIDFIERMKPNIVRVVADKDKADTENGLSNRMKVYDRGLKSLADKINYSLTKSNLDDYIYYILTRKKDKINEVGNSSYDYEIKTNSIDIFRAEFYTNDNIYVDFFAVYFNQDDIWDIAWTADHDLGVTGKGDQFAILSTIMKIMERFILTKNPKKISFTSDKIRNVNTGGRNSARTKIYKRAMDILTKKYNYDIKVIDQNHMDKFVLTKKNKLKEEINSKELTQALNKRIIKNAEKIRSADTYSKILVLVKNIATRHAYQMSKAHKSDIKYEDWTFEVKFTNNPYHSAEVGFNEYGMGLLKIFLSMKLTNEYLEKRKIPEEKDTYFEHYWNGIFRLLSHEMLHLEQWLRSKGKQSNRKTILGKLKTVSGKVQTDTEKEFKHYLSDKLEISAYSLNAIQELMHREIDLEKLYYQYILKNVPKIYNYMAEKSPSFGHYYRFFGRNKDDKKDQTVWNLFLKKFIYHLEMKVKE